MDLQEAFDSGEVEYIGPHGSRMRGRVYTKKKEDKDIPQANTKAVPNREETVLWSELEDREIGKAAVDPDFVGDSGTGYKNIPDISKENISYKSPIPKKAPKQLPKEDTEIIRWLTTVGGDRAAQIGALVNNKVLRKKMGIDDAWFRGLVRNAARGDESAQLQLDSLVAPRVSKEEQFVTAKRRGEAEEQKRTQKELGQKRSELELQEEFTKDKESRKFEHDKALSAFRASLKEKNPKALAAFDKSLEVFDELVSGATDERQVKQAAVQAFGSEDLVPPMVMERGFQIFRKERTSEKREDLGVNQESWEKAVKAVDEVAEKLYNTPEVRDAEVRRIASMYRVDPAVLFQRAKAYAPSDKQLAEKRFYKLLIESATRTLSPAEETWMERYQKTQENPLTTVLRQQAAAEAPPVAAPAAPAPVTPVPLPVKAAPAAVGPQVPVPPQPDIEKEMSFIRDYYKGEMTPEQEAWLRENEQARVALLELLGGK